MKRVQVLLSAYNGEKYVAQQMESILAQKQVRLSLLVRDDGSTDATLRILKQYAGNNVRVYTGRNIGVQKSFFDLIKHADADSDYYAFSDQDDVWHPRKLQAAVEALEKSVRPRKKAGAQAPEKSGGTQDRAERPLLYAGRVIYASCDLSIKKKSKKPMRKEPSFGNALVENICMGCTEVFNRPLLELVCSHLPDCGILHDWWLYMTAAYFGRVIFDENAYMLYRQHSKNQIGMQDTWGGRQMARLRRAGRLRGMISAQAQDFADIYRDIRKENDLLEAAAGYRHDWKKKLAVMTDGAVYRQDRIDQMIYRLLFGIGYL